MSDAAKLAALAEGQHNAVMVNLEARARAEQERDAMRVALERIAGRDVRHPWNVAGIALGRPCAHPRRDFNHGWYTCVDCGHDKYEAEATT